MIKEIKEDIIKFIEHKISVHDFKPIMDLNDFPFEDYTNCDFWSLVPCTFEMSDYHTNKTTHLKYDKCLQLVTVQHAEQRRGLDGFCINCFKIHVLEILGLFSELFERDVRNDRIHLFTS